MQGFQGYGYGQDFQRNLSKIINYLDSNPHCRLKVVADADVICQECPHLKDGCCDKSSHPSVLEMDLKVFNKLEIEEGSINTAKNLFSKVNKTISGDIQEICGECSWKSKCLLYQSK